jgi:Mrp family chromosome partitioning ATPase/capsular polysaccharide biosynthesis protein
MSADPVTVDPHGVRLLPKSGTAIVPELSADGGDSLREYLGVLARHKLVIALSTLLTIIAALAYSTAQSPLYRATASVLVTPGGASVLSDIPGLSATNDPERLAATYVSLARLPIVARRTVKSAGLDETAREFLERATVTADPQADILRFGVEDVGPVRAERLATIYAREFTRYRNELDLQAIRSTRATISRSLARLAERGQTDSALYDDLAQSVQRLDTAEALQGSAAVLVQPAIDATQIAPQTKRNLVLGAALGLLYGIALAFLIERLGTRVRSRDQVEAVLGLSALGELPKPPDTSKIGRRVSMLDQPYGAYAESVRKLRANVEFASLDTQPRTLMVTSAVQGEGKTTVAADLAVAFARSGRSVALCDLDARAPNVGAAFGVPNGRGLVDVVMGRDSLEHVLVPISWAGVPGSRPTVALAASRRMSDSLADVLVEPHAGKVGQLNILTLGSRQPHDAADFIGSSSVRQVIESLADSHELVIIDTAPLLPVSDARVVSEYVDAALIVCGLNTVRKPDLRTLRRIVPVLPTRVLGVAVTGAPPVPGYGYTAEANANRH